MPEIKDIIIEDSKYLKNLELVEMAYTDLEQKFIRLGLDSGALGDEVGNSAVMFFKSLRRRGVKPEELIKDTGEKGIEDVQNFWSNYKSKYTK
jgi:hypothetical protein